MKQKIGEARRHSSLQELLDGIAPKQPVSLLLPAPEGAHRDLVVVAQETGLDIVIGMDDQQAVLGEGTGHGRQLVEAAQPPAEAPMVTEG